MNSNKTSREKLLHLSCHYPITMTMPPSQPQPAVKLTEGLEKRRLWHEKKVTGGSIQAAKRLVLLLSLWLLSVACWCRRCNVKRSPNCPNKQNVHEFLYMLLWKTKEKIVHYSGKQDGAVDSNLVVTTSIIISVLRKVIFIQNLCRDCGLAGQNLDWTGLVLPFLLHKPTKS